MGIDQLEEYETAIEYARTEVPDLPIIKGLECEWMPEYKQYMKETFLSEKRFDYLIGAVHWIPYHGEWIEYEDLSPLHLRAYADYLIEGMGSGLFLFIAHPDIFGSGYRDWDENTIACSKDILEAAEELAIPLEINGNGMKKTKIVTGAGENRNKYPWLPFWQLAAEYDIRVICNSDAHAPEDVSLNIDACLEIARSFGLRQYTLSIDDGIYSIM
jgi:histidinol-phosphatase (PHP family)